MKLVTLATALILTSAPVLAEGTTDNSIPCNGASVADVTNLGDAMAQTPVQDCVKKGFAPGHVKFMSCFKDEMTQMGKALDELELNNCIRHPKFDAVIKSTAPFSVDVHIQWKQGMFENHFHYRYN